MARTLPIKTMVFPSTLKGVENGKLPPHLLTKIGVGSAQCEKTAARSFIAMFAEAKRTIGVDVRHVGHYRTFQEQLNLFLSRYEPTNIATYSVTPSAHRKKWDAAKEYGHSTVYWRKKKNPNGSYPATAASPGASNHGWGLAIDIAEEYDGDPQPDPIRDRFVEWLVGNAHRYGISAELQSEPWHWRYVAGDNIPLATRQYESGAGFTPIADPGPGLVFAYPGEPVGRGSAHTVAVKLVQVVVGAKPDGDFGAVTERRVKAWQKANGLSDSGLVDVATWKAMFG